MMRFNCVRFWELREIGHGGTLDPDVVGVFTHCCGEGDSHGRIHAEGRSMNHIRIFNNNRTFEWGKYFRNSV